MSGPLDAQATALPTTGRKPTGQTSPLVPLVSGVFALDELDIPVSIVNDLVLRILFFEGTVNLKRMAEVTRLELQLLDKVLEKMQFEKIVEVASAGTMGRFSYSYSLSEVGTQRARDALERSQYVGPAPVPIEKYTQAVLMQTEKKIDLGVEDVKRALQHLILPENFHRRIGPAVRAGTSIFLYGPPGNGKTTIAQAIAELIGGAEPIFIPYAVTVAGYIISIYDPLLFHEADTPPTLNGLKNVDKRWGYFKRPAVTVGGELTMDSLELRYDSVAKFYEAPLQCKANGGMFLIDDFGRQMISPAELLNRWIVPLESGYDFQRLRTGQALQIPFRQLIVFSTNLDPDQLVDGAFLRRIQMKVEVTGPDERMFVQILATMAKSLGVPLQKEAILYLLEKWYREPGREFQSVHPRDILKIVRSMCEYMGVATYLSPEIIDEACESYFVDSKKPKTRTNVVNM